MAKSENAFRTISEAAEEIGAPQHVLRFWETKFPFIAPVKRAGGRRFYRPDDVALLKAVRRLLHDEGLTIKGVQRLHKDQGPRAIAAWADPGYKLKVMPATVKSPVPEAIPASPPAATSPGQAARLSRLLADLETAKARLDAVLAG